MAKKFFILLTIGALWGAATARAWYAEGLESRRVLLENENLFEKREPFLFLDSPETASETAGKTPTEAADEAKASEKTETPTETADEAKAPEKTETPNDIPAAANASQTTFQNPTFNALLRHKREGRPFRLKLTRDGVTEFWHDGFHKESAQLFCDFVEETAATVRFSCVRKSYGSTTKYDVTFFATGPSPETGACTAVAVRVQTDPAECLGGTCEYFPVFFDADTTDCGQTQQPVFNHLFLNQPTTPAGFENPLFGRLLMAGTCPPFHKECERVRVTPHSFFDLQRDAWERCLPVMQDASKALLLCEDVNPFGLPLRAYYLFTPTPGYDDRVRQYHLSHPNDVADVLQNPDAHPSQDFFAVINEREEFSNFLLRPEE